MSLKIIHRKLHNRFSFFVGSLLVQIQKKREKAEAINQLKKLLTTINESSNKEETFAKVKLQLLKACFGF